MLEKRKLTILVVPSSPHQKVFSVPMPVLALTVLFLVSGILSLMASAGAWSMVRLHQLQQESHHLAVENRAAKSQIQDQETRIEYLTREISSIREKAGYVQSYLGLKPQDPGVGKIGLGGIELTPRSSEARPRLTRSTSHAPSLSAQDIRQLDMDLQQLVGSLKGRQEKLDRTPSVSPVAPQDSWISSSYGLRTSPFTGKEQFHPGVDIAGAEKTAIIAPAHGTIDFVGKDGALGLSVRIKHDSVYKSTYGHLDKAAVKRGQQVNRGDVIGYMGNSGRSTGHHLHYEIEKNGKNVNPLNYMTDWKNDNFAMIVE
jgi:murein DD-endopeptidase MepM/ murein hydrolase activator NlpD